jgi:hypothetical protein
MPDLLEYHVLEWSESQGQFDICLLQDKADQCLNAFMDKRTRGDWQFLGVFPTAKDASDYSAALAVKRRLVWNGNRYETAGNS